MLSTGFTGGAYKSGAEPLMPYPCLLAGVLISFYRIFNGFMPWFNQLHH